MPRLMAPLGRLLREVAQHLDRELVGAADVALMGDDLAKVEEAIRLGRQVRRISAQNIAFSLLVLAVLVPLAVTGFMGVTVAVLVHESSELLAVVNGLRAGRVAQNPAAGPPPTTP